MNNDKPRGKRLMGRHVVKPGGISKSAIRKLARRAGVRRLAASVYTKVKDLLRDQYIEPIMRELEILVDHAKRKTVSLMDVIYVLKRQGRTLYYGA